MYIGILIFMNSYMASKVGLIQRLDWYKGWTDTKVGLIQFISPFCHSFPRFVTHFLVSVT